MRLLSKKTGWVLALAALATLAALIAPPAYRFYQARQASQQAREVRVKQVQADKAEFQRLCKEVAGYHFYRQAQNVQGILLPKIRHKGDWRKGMEPGAAFALEAYDDDYISSFLFPRTPSTIGDNSYFVGNGPGPSSPGFQYVDVINERDGKRYRVTGGMKAVRLQDTNAPEVKRRMAEDPNYDLNVYNWVLDKVPTTEPAPRYAVTFEDHMAPAERARGLAASTVTVIDTQTNEVMAEMLRYAWTPGHASPENPRPWVTAYKCPGVAHGSDSATRQFVDRVLVPPGATAPPPPL